VVCWYAMFSLNTMLFITDNCSLLVGQVIYSLSDNHAYLQRLYTELRRAKEFDFHVNILN